MSPINKTEVGKIIITRLSRASWFMIETDNKILHFDPGYAGYFQNQRIPLDELKKKADIVFVSHCHKDHLQQEALNRIIKQDTVIVAPIKCASRINSKNLRIVQPGDSLEFTEIGITVVNAYNTQEGHSTRKVHHKGDFVGYLINLKGKSLYFAGDTDLIPEMKDLGKVDIAFLPIGGTFVMDIEEAVAAVCVIDPNITFPMHQSNENLQIFKSAVKSKSGSRIVTLEVGDKTTV